jgi:hypothetical protein
MKRNKYEELIVDWAGYFALAASIATIAYFALTSLN